MRGGKRDGGHEVSILIRAGEDHRRERAPLKVSTMIILSPQQGHGREGEGVSSRSASALGRSAEVLGAASAWRMRSMLRARTVPANRP